MRRILIIDDSAEDRELAARALRAGFPQGAEVTGVETFEEGLQAVRSDTFDVIILDCNLRGSTQLETAERVRLLNADRHAIVILTGYLEEGKILRNMKTGASRYMDKAILLRPDEFVAQIVNVLSVFRAKTEQQFSHVGETNDRMTNETLGLRIAEMDVANTRGRDEIKKMIAANTTISEQARNLALEAKTEAAKINGRVADALKRINALERSFLEKIWTGIGLVTASLKWQDWLRIGSLLFVSISAAWTAHDTFGHFFSELIDRLWRLL